MASLRTEPGKPCQSPRAFCPAMRVCRSAKSLNFRVIMFRACVMAGKARKRRATTPGPVGRPDTLTAFAPSVAS